MREIINIQFFITQSNTDASITVKPEGVGNHIAGSPLHLCSQQQKQKLFGEMIYVIMWRFCSGALYVYRFSRVGRAMEIVINLLTLFSCLLIEMQMQVEPDVSTCNTRTSNFRRCNRIHHVSLNFLSCFSFAPTESYLQLVKEELPLT